LVSVEYLHTKFHMPSSSISLVTTIKPKDAVWILCTTVFHELSLLPSSGDWLSVRFVVFH